MQRIIAPVSTFFVVWSILFGLWACHNSSDSLSGSGSVALLLTDGPAEDFAEVNVTITGVTLLSSTGPVSIYSNPSGETINLLNLASEAQFFAVADEVPAGWYDKVRLEVSRVGLIKDPGDAEELIKLPANGKIDLNPRRPFFVGPDQPVYLQLDIDANKSLHIVQTGNEKYRFRPVVFIKVLTREDQGKLVRLEGTVDAKGEDDFLLCQGGLIAERCFDIETAGAVFFNADGNPTTLEALQNGDQVTAVGHFRHTFPEEGDERRRFSFDALLVEIGDFLTLDGALGTPPAEQFAVDAGQGLSGDLLLNLQLAEETRILTPTGAPLSQADLTEGRRAQIDGVLALDNNDGSLLKAALVLIRETTEATMLEGEVSSIDYGAGSLTLETGLDTRCVTVTGATDVYLLVESGRWLIESLDFSALREDDTVRIFGQSGTECFAAEDLFIIEGEGE